MVMASLVYRQTEAKLKPFSPGKESFAGCARFRSTSGSPSGLRVWVPTSRGAQEDAGVPCHLHVLEAPMAPEESKLLSQRAELPLRAAVSLPNSTSLWESVR